MQIFDRPVPRAETSLRSPNESGPACGFTMRTQLSAVEFYSQCNRSAFVSSTERVDNTSHTASNVSMVQYCIDVQLIPHIGMALMQVCSWPNVFYPCSPCKHISLWSSQGKDDPTDHLGSEVGKEQTGHEGISEIVIRKPCSRNNSDSFLIPDPSVAELASN